MSDTQNHRLEIALAEIERAYAPKPPISVEQRLLNSIATWSGMVAALDEKIEAHGKWREGMRVKNPGFQMFGYPDLRPEMQAQRARYLGFLADAERKLAVLMHREAA